MNIAESMALYAALFFGAGWGWGQWWAERCARKEKKALESGRLTVSMPVNPKHASDTMRMLSDLVKQAEAAEANDGAQ